MPPTAEDRIALIAGMLMRHEFCRGDVTDLANAWGITRNRVAQYFTAAKFHVKRQWGPDQVRDYIIETMTNVAEEHPNHSPKACKLLADLFDIKPAKRVEVKVSELDDKQLTERLLSTIKSE